MPTVDDEENFVKGQIVLIQEVVAYEGDFTTDVVIAKEDFNYTDKWKEWENETGVNHRYTSGRNFYLWLLKKGYFESIDYNTFSY